jgi:hypothetical protein
VPARARLRSRVLAGPQGHHSPLDCCVGCCELGAASWVPRAACGVLSSGCEVPSRCPHACPHTCPNALLGMSMHGVVSCCSVLYAIVQCVSPLLILVPLCLAWIPVALWQSLFLCVPVFITDTAPSSARLRTAQAATKHAGPLLGPLTKLAAKTTKHSSARSSTILNPTRIAANAPCHSLSLLINAWASSIFWNSSASPMTLAASRTSRHVSSRRVMTRTMVPSGTSVRSVICWKGWVSQRVSAWSRRRQDAGPFPSRVSRVSLVLDHL